VDYPPVVPLLAASSGGATPSSLRSFGLLVV
jgi:hypothetical protein